ncbi:MAG: hypothetical protein CL910_08060 [Deltaproteobacteria bacterium]|nr:hypothetical protein [Deltaproteobacteria bacterium]
MLRVRIARPEEFGACLALRLEVFVEEQKVPRDEEEDGLDPECLHFLAFEGQQPVGTARLRFLDGDGTAERVAVRAAQRRFGVGRRLMQALESEARRRSAARVRLNAQLAALPFYEALGYRAFGGVFDDAGIPHRAMKKILAPHARD